MERLTYAEISEVLAVPGGTAKGWVSRGRDAMLTALAEKSNPGEQKQAHGGKRGSCRVDPPAPYSSDR